MNYGPHNGVCLSPPVHSGSHPNYTDSISDKLDAIWEDKQWPAAEPDLRTLITKQRARLKKKKGKLR